MKIILFNLLMIGSFSITAQTEVDFLNAIGKGQMAKIDNYLSDNVNFCVNDDQILLDKATALNRIKRFFASKNIKRFKVLHKGKSSDRKSSYRVARITTDSGRYRVFAYSEGAGGTANKVTEVRIDKM